MRLISLGEAMVELSPHTQGLYRRGFAGDTLNTAWYAQAALGGGVAYVTVVGQDAVSRAMTEFIADAGIETGLIRSHPSRTVGLYMIALKDGERSFTYWRDGSAARTLADDPVWLEAALTSTDMIYFSGITLAILAPSCRETLFSSLQHARAQGARVAFDPNLRPRLWRSTQEMRDTVMRAAALSDIALPSFDDEATVFGDQTLQDTAQRYAEAGVAEVMVKNGGGEMLALDHGVSVPVTPDAGAVAPVDTTGAGDSFNGAYLAARLDGMSVGQAAQAGHKIARMVVQHPGALVPMEDLRS